MKNVLETMKTRRSIRTYTSQPVERHIIEEIVDCARLAPTAMNDQPWEFVVITTREDLHLIPQLLGHAEFIANAAFCVLVLARETTCAVEDCCAATENLLLAAEAHGLGACWVAGAQRHTNSSASLPQVIRQKGPRLQSGVCPTCCIGIASKGIQPRRDARHSPSRICRLVW